VANLTKRLHKELEWTPLKAMRKDRVKRYRFASEMSDDIQNYLSGSLASIVPDEGKMPGSSIERISACNQTG
jgi:hypothetical protein